MMRYASGLAAFAVIPLAVGIAHADGNKKTAPAKPAANPAPNAAKPGAPNGGVMHPNPGGAPNSVNRPNTGVGGAGQPGFRPNNGGVNGGGYRPNEGAAGGPNGSGAGRTLPTRPGGGTSSGQETSGQSNAFRPGGNREQWGASGQTQNRGGGVGQGPERPNGMPTRPSFARGDAGPGRGPGGGPRDPGMAANAGGRLNGFQALHAVGPRGPDRRVGMNVAGRAPNGAWMHGTRRYMYHGHSHPIYLAPVFVYPPGYGYRRFLIGAYLPQALVITDYIIAQPSDFGLPPPPEGSDWVRVGPDALLVSEETYEVKDNIPGMFEESASVANQAEDAVATAPAPPAVDPALPPDFATGKFHLGHGPTGGCLKFYNDPAIQADIDASWKDEDWNALAGKVIKLGCETDLAFYLLGLSAEGLGLGDAAGVYYRGAVDINIKHTINPYKRCKSWNEACRGIDVVAESEDGLRRVKSGS